MNRFGRFARLMAIAPLAIAAHAATAQESAIPATAVRVPQFLPPAGAYLKAQTVTITDATPNTTIYYTTHGDSPTASSDKYTKPIEVSETETIKVLAVAKGLTNSDASGTYEIDEPAAEPRLSPRAGTYTTAQSVTITDSTKGAVIYYTTNGTVPSKASTRYTDAIKVGSTETIEAIAIASGYNNSAVAAATYTINLPTATPTFSPAAGAYTGVRVVTISDETSVATINYTTIYYTTDGSTPTTRSNLYEGPVLVSSTETIKAIAVAAGYTKSAVAEAKYTITDPEENILTFWSVTPDPGTGRIIVSWARAGTMPNAPANSQQASVLSEDTVPNLNSSTLEFTKVLQFVGSPVKVASSTADSSTTYFLDQGSPWTVFAFGRASTLNLSAGRDSTAISYKGSVATPFNDPDATASLFNSSQNIFVAASNSSTPVFYSIHSDGSLDSSSKEFVPLSSTSSHVTEILGDPKSNPCFVYGNGSKPGDGLQCSDRAGRATLSATFGVFPVNTLVGTVAHVIPYGTGVTVKPASNFGEGTETKLYLFVQANRGENSGVTLGYRYVQPGAPPKVIDGEFPGPGGGRFKLAKTIVARAGSSPSDTLVDVVEQEDGTGRDVAVVEYDVDTFTGTPVITEIGNTIPGDIPGLGGPNVTINVSPSPVGLLISSSSTTASGFYLVPSGSADNSLGAARMTSSNVQGILGQQPDTNGNTLLQNVSGVGGLFWNGESMFGTSTPSTAPNPSQGTSVVP